MNKTLEVPAPVAPMPQDRNKKTDVRMPLKRNGKTGKGNGSSGGSTTQVSKSKGKAKSC